MFLTNEEEKMANGEYGETIRKSMDILIALGDIYGAEKFVDIKSAQVSGVSYKTIGQAGLEYLEDLASTSEIIYNENGTISDKSGIATISATLNPAGTDLDNWEDFGFPADFARKQVDICNAYGALGISTTCTCTPYLIGNVPRFGDHVSWSESSAVAYVNSVIGARTNREGGPGALAAAIVGKTPLYGFHLEENRKANLLVEVESELERADFGALGYAVGQIVKDGIPYFKMQNKPYEVSNGNLKALGAALASSGAVALYHVEDVTPEFANAAIDDVENKITITKDDIVSTREKLSTADGYADLVCLGCPHASLEEVKEVAEIVKGKKIKNELWVCTSINIKEAAKRLGYLETIEKAGGKICCDTCMVVAPIEQMGYEVIGVNSAKAANYVPSMCGLRVIYNDIEDLLDFE
ncbi:aconitase [Methanobrevibacter ruminantium M1]|uniref:Phosphomevalonate dehydratase large subunit n=1 Tax=Methanobrevibacter ruminantium (strain ATCC 35063 / DSM 1093 / JCM 13430 / OCM 146 / M1) TaxID=634498 RepID=D3E0X1_METRM|nr:aconitase X catalytic domain-containing protein [Methanobrevibacter ruminantium]ADC47945.1 aconitase [Methanobrevibacter ruminantium M1]